MSRQTPTGHPEQARLLHALRCSPVDPRTWRLRWHLFRCARCRSLCLDEEARLFALFAPYERALDRWIGDESVSRQRLLTNMRSSRATAHPVGIRRLSASRPGVLAFGLLAASACLLYIIAAPIRTVPVSAADVLNRAAALDDSSQSHSQAGVTFRRVEVTVCTQRLEWASYRDRQGKRKSRVQQSSTEEANLDQRLASAGIEKDDPLSAVSYRQWRSRLGSFTDNIVHAPSGLYIITTSLPANSPLPIKAETLTLRGDYHPIRRTVAFRDNEEIQIAELDYQMLRWDQVRAGLFEESVVALPIASPLPSPRAEPPPALTDADLTYTELQARLALSKSNLDVNEQLSFVRNSDGVHIHGVVSSPAIKQEIHEALVDVRHVSEDIQSPADLEQSTSVGNVRPVQKLTVVQTISQPSPLYAYWKSQNENPDELSALSGKMLDAALRINQQSHALLEVTRRFSFASRLDDPSRASLQALVLDHAEKLEAALSIQRQALKLLKVTPPDASTPGGNPQSSLQSAVEELDRHASRSLTLTHQLNTGDESDSVDAKGVLAELKNESTDIAALLNRILMLNR